MNLGAVRKLDANGRVQLPIGIREKLGIKDTTPLNVYEEQGKVIISPLHTEEE